MDHLSIIKILEEDEKDESKHSENDVDVLQEALLRDIQGRPQPQYMKLQKMSSQQAHEVEQRVDPVNHGLTVGICDLIRILIEHQPDKDKQRCFLTLYYKFKRQEITLQGFIQNLRVVVGDQMIRSAISQLHQLQPRVIFRQLNPLLIQDGILDRYYLLADSPNLSVQDVMGNMGLKVPGRPNHDKVSKSAEIRSQESDYREVHVNQLPSTTSGTLSSSATLQGLNKHPKQYMELPSSPFHMTTNSGSLNPYPGKNVTSPGSSSRTKLPDFSNRANNQNVGPASVEGPTKSKINMTTVPKFERPTSVNGPRRVQNGPISDFQNNSFLPLYSAPWQESVAKDQRVGPSSSVVYVEQKSIAQIFDQAQKPHSLVQQGMTNVPPEQNKVIPISSNDDFKKKSSKMVLSTPTTSVPPSMSAQLDSSTTLNLPAASPTIPTRANVRKSPGMPSVGQKKPLEALGSSMPPSRKKQKLCETSSDRSIEKFNDVTAVSGINLQEEENQLLGSGPKKNSRVSKASQRLVHEEEERTILQKIPLQRKLTEIMAKSGLRHIDHDVERCLSLCVEERMRGLLSNIIRRSKQRTDAEKCRHQTFITSDIGKEINEMNKKVKEEWEKKHAIEEKVKNGANITDEEEDKRTKIVKAKKDEDQRKAANVAVHAAFGGDDRFSKWKLMAEARQKSSPGTGRKSKKLSGETGDTQFGKNQCLPKVVRSISVKDVIAVVEKEPQMTRSMLLYRLYHRICSDVSTQEKR